MDTNLTLELFIGRGMIDKSLAKDIKEEMIASGKELPEVLADFGIIGSKDDIWQMIASDLGTEFITLDNFQPDPNVQNMMPATLVRLHGALPVRPYFSGRSAERHHGRRQLIFPRYSFCLLWTPTSHWNFSSAGE